VSASFDFPAPQLFTAGTVGPPGQRAFYLQARQADTLVTLKVEKQQVSALAEYLAGLLERLPATARAAAAELEEPILPAWVVGSIGVAYDQDAARVVLVIEEAREEAAEEPPEHEPSTARFVLTHAQAATFVERARHLVAAGRPPCRLCGRPLDPKGHVCARLNGHGAG
jgi:uncharacterized repeat protein (TIGR03847 family)